MRAAGRTAAAMLALLGIVLVLSGSAAAQQVLPQTATPQQTDGLQFVGQPAAGSPAPTTGIPLVYPPRNFTPPPSDCGTPGKPCCCPVAAAGRVGCCKDPDLSCYKFDTTPGQSLGLCMPTDAPAKGCGFEDGPCCVANRANRYEVTCQDGLTCIPPSDFVYRSAGQHAKLSAAFSTAYFNPTVMGTCKRKVTCNAAFNPCGADDCPNVGIACPKGFYCANYADATVGARCLLLPEDAGKAGGQCLPSNMLPAPVTLPGFPGPLAPPFCSGKNDVCFTFTGPISLRHNSFKLVFDPAEAKRQASRIWDTLCVTVPNPCGGVGQPCCPGVGPGLVVDKPLYGFGKKWQGRPCDDTQTPEGAYCNGQWTALGGPMYGKCVANEKGCNDIGNKCCIRTSSDKSERYCKGDGKRVYCVFTDNTCRLCPPVTETLLDFFVCT